MKFLKIITLTLSISVLFLYSAWAQDISSGYVITAKGDTVKCEFKYPVTKLRYKPLNATKYLKINADDIREFYVNADSSVYEAILAGRGLPDPEFLKRLETGAMNLYEENNSWSLNQNSIIPGKTTVWYVDKKNKPLIELKSENVLFDSSRKSRKASFIEMISDDQPLVEKLKNERNFDLKTLRNYITEYNSHKTAQQNK